MPPLAFSNHPQCTRLGPVIRLDLCIPWHQIVDVEHHMLILPPVLGLVP